MKTRTRLLLLATTMAGIVLLNTGCNKPQQSADSLPSNPASGAHNVPTHINDSDVTSRVKSALLQDDSLKNSAITVVTLKGDVRLTGAVENQSQIDYVDKLVRSIEGVHTIHDELSIKK